MLGISDSYLQLEPGEVETVAAELASAWQDPAIPRRQWISVVRGEMERLRQGQWLPHFAACVQMAKATGLDNPTLLDVGASSGFYSEILKLGGFDCRYTGLDYSAEYKKLAEEIYLGIDFEVGDATCLPFGDGTFDIVLSGCVLIHVYRADLVIAESARVASKYVIMARTPILIGKPTSYYEKRAYGVRCLEIHFNEIDLLDLFAMHGLEVVSYEDVSVDEAAGFHSRTYLLRRLS